MNINYKYDEGIINKTNNINNIDNSWFFFFFWQ